LECDGGWRHGDEEEVGVEREERGRREERAGQVERELGGVGEELERGGVGKLLFLLLKNLTKEFGTSLPVS
jgi:hypothetical protein